MTRLERLARRLDAGTTLSDYLGAHAEAHLIVVELDKRKQRVRAKSKPRREAKREAKRLDREASASLRAEVADVADYRCERCSTPRDLEDGHAHHLYGGNGRRRAMERVQTMAWLCGTCHAHVHANPLDNKALRHAIAAKRGEETT